MNREQIIKELQARIRAYESEAYYATGDDYKRGEIAGLMEAISVVEAVER